MNSTFLRITQVEDKASALLNVVGHISTGRPHADVFRMSPVQFTLIPGAPLSYWVTDGVRRTFSTQSPLHQQGVTACSGGKTLMDFRFLRAWWESAGEQMLSYSKGGRFSRYYADVVLRIAWKNNARELKTYLVDYRLAHGWSGNWTAELHGSDHYGRPGLTWPRRTNGLSVRALPQGGVFGDKGPAAFVAGDRHSVLLALCALMDSAPFGHLLRSMLARLDLAQSFEVGLVQQVPSPVLSAFLDSSLDVLARHAWFLKRSVDTITENSHAFHLPALLHASGPLGETLFNRATAWSLHVTQTEAELATIQAEIDDIAFRLYGIAGEDRARIEAESGTAPAVATDDDATESAGDDETEDDDESDTPTADTATLATELVSWSIGVAFGRFDLRHATGELPPPVEPGPFDPLPARSPGMCPDDALAVEFLVDDPGHALDLSARVADVFARVFPADHEARLDEAVRLSGSPDLPTFLRRTFFPFHLKRYSKSRRKAPIWWPLSTAAGGYTVWLAWPRLTRDTLFRVADELKRQKLPFETRKLTSLKQDAGPNPSTREKSAIAAQEDFVSELNALLEEVERVAPLWNPVHDDGVILHFALLWRVVRDAAWQKECRGAWEKLAKGDYDWAHAAMHLWPERVAPKCRTDRSLAIAHGLEDTFWVEVNGKWQARPNTDAALTSAVAERSSPAVKAALRSFESAPVPSRGGRGRRAG